MKDLNKNELVNLNGGCFSYYAGWFIREVVGSVTHSPSGEAIVNTSAHHATCDE
jgi:hypothetical protein